MLVSCFLWQNDLAWIKQLQLAHNEQRRILLMSDFPMLFVHVANVFVENLQKHEKRTFPSCACAEKVVKYDIIR